ncbi:hypothetical protein F5Y15DRAFT_412490 [Xylariaceae sp. FL0016]|nr:hypothetical protein F5Y15DRAFT_412490 [Xylariaceae sp. FL0016]
MNARRNSIEYASAEIVKWIFSPEERRGYRKPQCESVDWLGSDKPLYWISGQAGSGKSTLVEHLTGDDQTIKHLMTWKASVNVLQFYFFEIGSSPLQKCLFGCLRTLLYQILDRYKDNGNLGRLLSAHPEIAKKDSEHDWSKNELSDLFLKCLQFDINMAFCLFLDGLDEVQGDERMGLAELVESLTQLSNVKVCVSSRPENPFQRQFGSLPNLRMQDLANSALEAYVKLTLAKFKASLKVEDDTFQNFTSDLVEKSEGIFLWVVLALQSIIRGIQNGDTWKLLYTRI